jgi:uncharacterized lipoprotein
VEIPAGLSEEKIQAHYPIPEVSNKRPLPEKYELPKPPNATAILEEAPYLVERLDDQLWLRVYSAPGKVWPLIDAFWREYGIATASEDITRGYVETKKLQNPERLILAANALSPSAFDLEDSYFQLELAQGIRRNTSEIKLRVIHADAQTTSNPDTEKALLSVLGEFITSDAMQNRYSLLANTIGGESRIQLLQGDDGQNYLQMKLSFQRAWSELDKALESAEIIVADKNFSEKKFFISYLNVSRISEWYLSEARINEMKSERNFVLLLEELPEGIINIRVEQLNDNHDAALMNELLDLVFEHIS